MIYEKMEANKKRDKKILDGRFTNDRCKLKTTRAGKNVSQRNVVFKSGFELAQRGLQWWVVAQELHWAGAVGGWLRRSSRGPAQGWAVAQEL